MIEPPQRWTKIAEVTLYEDTNEDTDDEPFGVENRFYAAVKIDTPQGKREHDLDPCTSPGAAFDKALKWAKDRHLLMVWIGITFDVLQKEQT